MFFKTGLGLVAALVMTTPAMANETATTTQITGAVDAAKAAPGSGDREFAELSVEARTAFALFAIDGRSIVEVAQLTQTSVVAAKCRIWRARREVMKHAAQDPVLAELVKNKGEEEVP